LVTPYVDLEECRSLLLLSDETVRTTMFQRMDEPMRYVLLIYGSEALPQEERAAIMRAHPAFLQEVQQRGLLAGGAALQTTSSATTVRVRDGKTMITDGPFAETKEQLAGFYILDCKDLDEAIAMAAKVPDAVAGSIEIRPVVEF
jgi:hypothetical protein